MSTRYKLGDQGPQYEYRAIAAGQTAEPVTATGKIGDLLQRVIIAPAVVACGAVAIKDGADTAITIFVGGGTTALADARPIVVELGLESKSGGWQITTGANVSVVVAGYFS